jgi:hypothetical protein
MRGIGNLALIALAGLALAGTAAAAPLCSSNSAPVLGGVGTTLSGGTNLFNGSFSCSIGPYTFSNFDIYGASIPSPISNFSLTVTADAAGDLIIQSTNLGADDVNLSFQISPGILGETLTSGAGASVSEFICSSPGTIFTHDNLGCTSVISTNPSWTSVNGSPSFSSVAAAGTDYVFKDWSGGSDVIETLVPEPMTFSLLGLGLLGIGLAGRRLRKK